MPKIKYISDGDADEVEVFGVSFSDGKAVDVSDDVAARLKGNPYFKVSADAKSEDDTAKAAKAKADQERADRAAADAKAKADKEAADKAAAEEAERLKAEQGQSTLKAVHNGGGRFVIKDGDKIVKDGLDKADAAAFNALTPEDQAEYVKD